jgi:hypothetical protein
MTGEHDPHTMTRRFRRTAPDSVRVERGNPVVARRLRVGVNLPWINCGWDFGIPPPGYVSDARRRTHAERWRTDVRAKLDQIKDTGAQAVRFWVLGDGRNFPDGQFHHRPTDPGHSDYDAANRAMRPLPVAVSRSIQDDFRWMLEQCRDCGLLALPSLLSFEWMWDGNLTGKLYRPLPPGEPSRDRRDDEIEFASVKGGRSLLLVGDHGQNFLDHVVGPLAAIAADMHHHVLAFEVMNEPEGWDDRWRGQDGAEDVLREFLPRAVEFLASNFPFSTSIGWRHTDTAADWGMEQRLRRVQRYVHQLHFYAHSTPPILPAHSQSAIRPCWLGEFGSAPPGDARGALSVNPEKGPASAWRDPGTNETDPQRFLEARLEVVEARGYPWAFVWSAQDPPSGHPSMRPDQNTEWRDLEREQIRRFTARRRSVTAR